MKSILHIPSDVQKLNEVRDFVSIYFEHNSISKKNFNRVFLLISEAVNNSITHGNGNCIDKNVVLIIEHQDDMIDIEIIDEGSGFNYKDVVLPTLEHTILKEKGRGIFLIRKLSDFCEFYDGGRKLIIKCSLI